MKGKDLLTYLPTLVFQTVNISICVSLGAFTKQELPVTIDPKLTIYICSIADFTFPIWQIKLLVLSIGLLI